MMSSHARGDEPILHLTGQALDQSSHARGG